MVIIIVTRFSSTVKFNLQKTFFLIYISRPGVYICPDHESNEMIYTNTVNQFYIISGTSVFIFKLYFVYLSSYYIKTIRLWHIFFFNFLVVRVPVTVMYS